MFILAFGLLVNWSLSLWGWGQKKVILSLSWKLPWETGSCPPIKLLYLLA